LLIEGRGNRQQIGQQLSREHAVIVPDENGLPASGFDLAIADGPGLRKWHDALAAAKAAQQPVFLPVMLILPRTEVRGRASDLASIIDEFVTSPIDRAEFLQRVYMLLRARRQALAQRDELVRMVNFDHATGLPNRYLFTDRVASALRSADARDLTLSVLAVHIPLAQLLESIGERAVEEAATVCSARLCELIDDDIGLARLSMEKWAGQFLTGTPIEEVLEVCAWINRMAAEPIEVGGEVLHLAPRLGVAVYPDDATDAAGLIDAAITAGNRARKGTPAFYASDQRDAALHYMRTEAGLHEALARHQFELWLQPKLALGANRVDSAEALIRWRLPSGDLVPPSDFIPVAESSGIIREITHWVLETAICTVADWHDSGSEDLSIAVNVTPADVQQADFLSWLQARCREHGVAPGYIELELTETMLCDMDRRTTDRLRALRDAGFSIAIDDFGTGYSSLGYLHQLPAHTLKIDKSFIDQIPGDAAGEAVLRAVIKLAREFELEVVAEGIEHQEQLAYLRAAGVDHAQGYCIARPMPLTDFRSWMAQHA